MPKNIVVLGCQWGDEGKGKIVDLLAAKAGAVIRFQGGHNAGHTLVYRGDVFKLHLIPSAVLHPCVKCLIGNGVVLSPKALLEEVHILESYGLSIRNRLRVSRTCTLLLPYHVALDHAREEVKGVKALGTTGRGIGPAYEDKIARRAIRFNDLFNPTVFRQKLEENVSYYNFLLTQYYQSQPVDFETIYRETMEMVNALAPLATDISDLLHQLTEQGHHLIFEGAQGALLDIDHGTYPFVTSSSTMVGGVAPGTGFPPLAIDEVLGVMKVYATRVGAGPFPTELRDENGEWLAIRGKEVGTTTGRRRRCGWFDAVAARHVVRLNGVTRLSLTKLDVLDGLKTIKICVAYRLGSKVLQTFPCDAEILAECEPIYEELPGWTVHTSQVTQYEQLPDQAIRYLERISQLINASIDIISTGAERDEIIMLREIL
ncbi:MAG: adenylosuccinate synthase [Gammaproteobacteria bacterium GWF2_41_13]|nr:MAG: adenylosuccinate synthase [Gammaproteobacteria bacterium GWF2_41_13]